MAEVSGVSGSSAPPIRSGAVRPVPTVDENPGGGQGGAAPARSTAESADSQRPQVIRFEGQDLDPTAPRGTYLDIVV
jgi:hypothetical protein